MSTTPPTRQLALLQDQRELLELMASGVSLRVILSNLCHKIEEQFPSAMCSVLVLDESGQHVQNGAAPSLPKAFSEAIERAPIGPQAGSCGTAAFERKEILVEDIQTDPLWEPYRTLARTHRLGACASVPIFGPQEKVLGTFALYHRDAGPFEEEELALMRIFTGLASLAIRGHLREEALKNSESLFRGLMEQASDAIFLSELQDGMLRLVRVNQRACELLGYTREELLRMSALDLLTPEEREIAPLRWQSINQNPTRSERVLMRKNGARIPVEVSASMLSNGMIQSIVRDIRERKDADRRLEESRARYRTLFNSIPDPAWVYEQKGFRFLEVNDAALRQYGYSREAFLKMTLYDVRPESEHAKLDTLKPIEGPRGPTSGRFLHQRKDGSLLTVEVTAHDIAYSKPGDRVAVVRDITDQLKAEEALRRSEQQFRKLIESIPLGIVVFQNEMIEYANPAAGQITGVQDVQSTFGKPILDFIHPKEWPSIEARHEIMRAGGSIAPVEMIFLRSDGQEVPVEAMALALTSEAPPKLMCIFQDISVRHEAAEVLRMSEETFRALFNAAPIPMALTQESDGRFLMVNLAARNYFGASEQDEPSNHSTLDFYAHPEARDLFIQELSRKGSLRDYDLDLLVNGIARRFLVSATRTKYLGKPAILAGYTDITDRLRTEEALRSAQKLESLGVLAGGIAHDFNNLLTAMLGNLNLAQLQSSPVSPIQPYLENMEKTVLRAAELTKQMLAYSGKGRFVVRTLDLNHAVEELTHLLSVSISKQVSLRYHLKPGLRPLEADAAQLQQVIMNLVTNASDAIGDHEGTISISTGEQRLDQPTILHAFADQTLEPGDYLTLEVSDSGCGMEPEVLDRIFDPFFTTKATGRGLGLSAMLGILRGHRAGIKIYSEVGRGSTFKLLFPASGETHSPSEEPAPVARPRVSRGVALVVDDEPEIRTATLSMFEMLGFDQVLTAGDGQEALDVFQTHADRVSLVLMDLTMPRMNGKDAFRAMREIKPEVRVILTSGYNEQEAVQEFLGRGLAGFIQKPYRFKDLQKLVDEVMAKVR
jgi:two-component system, cell cycle sensor histidine kinase and response regulator CckA